ncbi:hypothetical protein [Microbacterium sp. USTB-Y]|uniref:hypothetical protein n=1 Tax=Microbacterium sp. USTB-Y TaxID=2823692 RepID=UPI00203BB77F|nr:hypothetical protein [Microbacterium sp. USTB-Y]
MDHAIKATLDMPQPPAVALSNDKACFSAPYHIWQGTKIYSSWYANTISSVNNNIVITAYLSDSYWTSDCSED